LQERFFNGVLRLNLFTSEEQFMNNNVYKIVLLTIGLILFGITLYVYRPVQNRYTRITVVGDSQTKVAPDTAQITFSVVTQNAQALNAQQENSKKAKPSSKRSKPRRKTLILKLKPAIIV